MYGLNTALAGLDGWLATGLPPRMHWETYAELASTNTHLLSQWAALPDLPAALPCVLAYQQTAGRGRLGRVWQSALGASVCWSFVWPCHAKLVPMLPVAIGLGLVWGLNEWAVQKKLTDQAQLKWPNDVYVQGSKLAGVLCEAVHGPCGPAVVVGVGLNRTAQAWLDVRQAVPSCNAAPTDLAAHWSPSKPLPEALEIAQTLWPWVLSALWLMHAEGPQALVDAVASVDALHGQPLWVLGPAQAEHNAPVAAFGLGLDADGAYRVSINNQVCLMRSGDVSLRLAAKWERW